MFEILSGLGWPFPLFSGATKRLSLQLYGQEEDLSGNLTDHEILRGYPVFMGGNAIDLKSSPPFWIRFSYPVTLKVMVVYPGKFGDGAYHPVRTKVYRKGHILRWRPDMATHWGGYPGVTGIWLVQESPSGGRA